MPPRGLARRRRRGTTRRLHRRRRVTHPRRLGSRLLVDVYARSRRRLGGLSRRRRFVASTREKTNGRRAPRVSSLSSSVSSSPRGFRTRPSSRDDDDAPRASIGARANSSLSSSSLSSSRFRFDAAVVFLALRVSRRRDAPRTDSPRVVRARRRRAWTTRGTTTTKTRPSSSSSLSSSSSSSSLSSRGRETCVDRRRGRRTVSSTPPRRSTRRAMTMDSTMAASSRVDSTFGRRGLTVEM